MENLNLPPFYVGQKVVSLVSKDGGYNSLNKGEVYTVLAIERGCEHCKWVIDIGKKQSRGFTECRECGFVINGLVHWANAAFFAPIESTFQSITFQEVAEIESKLISIN